MLVGAGAILAWRLTARDEPQADLAAWVCDACGAEATRPFESRSPDCRACAEGQMVQRVYFKCAMCGSTFEGYQVNWSPKSPRAEPERAEADAEQDRRPLDPDAPSVLVRRPGGKWAWTGSRAGLAIMRKLECPRCGPGPASQFVKQLRED